MVSVQRSPMATVYNRRYLPPATLEEAKMATAQRISLFVLIGLTCFPAWGQAGKNPPQNGPQIYDAPKVTTGENPTPQPVDPNSYLIGPEDVLHVEVFRDQDMTRTVNVRPDGKITMPLIGDLQAENLTPERLGAQIKEALAQFENNPQVTVSVLAVNSKSFTVSGRVNRVGKWPLVTPIRIFDAIGLAGGFQEFANDKDIQIVRGAQRLHFNYRDYVKGKKEALDQNIWLQNGDTIVVK
jgi:polysaccharide biosynthesis/export protein